MDEFRSHHTALDAPAQDAAAITPSDSTPLPLATRGIYVGSGGSLRVRMISGEEVTFANVQPGAFYPLRLSQVMATGTSAGGLVALR